MSSALEMVMSTSLGRPSGDRHFNDRTLGRALGSKVEQGGLGAVLIVQERLGDTSRS